MSTSPHIRKFCSTSVRKCILKMVVIRSTILFVFYMICFWLLSPKLYPEYEKYDSWVKVVSVCSSFYILEAGGKSCWINQSKISIKEETLGRWKQRTIEKVTRRELFKTPTKRFTMKRRKFCSLYKRIWCQITGHLMFSGLFFPTIFFNPERASHAHTKNKINK